jgi:plastocyanin
VAPIATLALLLCAAPASADEQIVAAPPSQYLTTQVTVDQGEKVTFMNTDPISHDVLARDAGPDGQPLFRSELIGAGQTVPVEGVEYLTTGSYAFFCSIHPDMEGTIDVTSAGTPAPRPGPGPGGGGGGAEGPSLALRVLDKRVGPVKRRGALKVRATTGAAATVKLKARAKGSSFAKGTKKVGSAGKKTLRLKLTKAGRKLVKGGGPITVTVKGTATDSQGQTADGEAKTATLD